MSKLLYFISVLSFLAAACSVSDKFLGSDNCTDEVDVTATTFETYKHRAQDLSPLIQKSGALKLADKSLSDNYSKVTSWIGDIPRFDRVHKEATRYFVSSNSNFLKAVGDKETLDKMEKEISDLSKTATEDEKQAKYLQILNDPAMKDKMNALTSKNQKISEEKKGFLDNAYIHLSYALIYDAATVGLSGLIVTQGKSQVDNIKSSIKEPLTAAKKSRCLQKSVSRATDISSEASSQISPAINIYNAIVKLYSDNGYKLPEVASASGKPITSDLP
jgi:hypothetical protein